MACSNNAARLFTDRYTQNDVCQIVNLNPEQAAVIEIPVDSHGYPEYVTFIAPAGDYVVSLAGEVTFNTSTPSNISPFFCPRGLSLEHHHGRIYLFSKKGVTLKICWYAKQPTGTPIDNRCGCN